MSEPRQFSVSASYDVPYVETFLVTANTPAEAARLVLEEPECDAVLSLGGGYADEGGETYIDCVAEGKGDPWCGPPLPFPIENASPVEHLGKSVIAFLKALETNCAVDLEKGDETIDAHSKLIGALTRNGFKVDHLLTPVKD